MNEKESRGYPGKAYPKTQEEKNLMGRLTPYGAKVIAIQKAIKDGQKFYCHTYVGKLEVLGIDTAGSWALTGKGLQQRSWAICSTQIDRWYSEIDAMTTELCGNCSIEVEIPAQKPSKCPNCGCDILPCDTCDRTKSCDWNGRDGCWRFSL